MTSGMLTAMMFLLRRRKRIVVLVMKMMTCNLFTPSRPPAKREGTVAAMVMSHEEVC